MMELPSSCVDYRGRSVSIPPEVAGHVVRRHPEMRGQLDKICDVLNSPTLVYFRQRTDSYLFYKLGVLSGRVANNYMVVVVRYLDTGNLVKTAYSTGRPASGDSLTFMHRGG